MVLGSNVEKLFIVCDSQSSPADFEQIAVVLNALRTAVFKPRLIVQVGVVFEGDDIQLLASFNA